MRGLGLVRAVKGGLSTGDKPRSDSEGGGGGGLFLRIVVIGVKTAKRTVELWFGGREIIAVKEEGKEHLLVRTVCFSYYPLRLHPLHGSLVGTPRSRFGELLSIEY